MRHSGCVNVNRSWWNERAAVHGQDDVYDTRGFLAGRSTLYRLDLDVTGDVTGRDLIHLQCHTGMHTLSWLRAGAGSGPSVGNKVFLPPPRVTGSIIRMSSSSRPAVSSVRTRVRLP